MNISSSKEKNLTSYIRDFQSKNDFKKYLYTSITLLIVLESILGLSFNNYFSNSLEQNRKESYTKAWDNYLQQKWKADYSTVTGNLWWDEIWQTLTSGNIKKVHIAFNADNTIRENYDFFSIYLNPESKPVYTLWGANVKDQFFLLNQNLIKKYYALQSNKPGIFQNVVKIQDDKFFLISISALCDNLGNPIQPGIAIFALDLNRFLRLAEEVIPVSMKIRNGKPTANTYHYFLIPDKLGLGDEFYIEINPEYEIQTLVFQSLLFFICIQILISLTLFLIIAPKYTKMKTQSLEKMIEESEKLNFELNKKVEELKIAQLETESSEAKYKHLVESSKDIIFSFDSNGFILTANKALIDFLGFKKNDLIGKFFLDLAYNAEKKVDSLEKQLLMEKFEELKKNQSSVSFDMTFGTKNNEPLQLGVKWEYVKIGDSFVVFGKAFTVSEDSMLKYFESENRKYVFNNYITLAEQVSQRITSNLVKYIDPQDVFNVRICVREIIINSIEHGNLNIDYETKTKLRSTSGGYFSFLQERQNNPNYKDKRVTVWYFLKSDRVSFLIKDEGKGFDHKKLLADNAENANLHFLSHGRGIFMTKNTFDVIRYNQTGNKVLLIKYFKS